MFRKITLQLWLMLVAMPFAFTQSGTLVPSFEENKIKPGAENTKEQVDLQNGLIAYYPFNGNANDESGNGHNGTVNGATLTMDRFGNPNSAYFFNGQDNTIIVSGFILPSSATTISCWVKAISANGLREIISKHLNAGNVEILIRVIDYKYTIEWTIGGTYFVLSDNTGNFIIDPNHPRFDFLALVYDGQQVRFYINNTLIGSKNISGQIVNNDLPMVFGQYAGNYTGNNPGYLDYFNGTIDDIRIYNRALNSAEILALYNEEEVSAILPVLVTKTISNITKNNAASGGTISSDGGSAIISKGVCWSTSPNADTTNNNTNDGTGNMTYKSTLDGLTENTIYYVRAYGVNSAGVGYGNELAFSTFSVVHFDSIADIEGNLYKTVKIGNQNWMAENLKTTKYNDGTDIPNVTNETTWRALTTPAYCWFYFDNATTKNIYGALYNWYTVNTGKVCPTDWHVPIEAEWTVLINYLGGKSVAGGKLKESGTTHWCDQNTGATDETGFTALPGGIRSIYDGQIGTYGGWWADQLGDVSMIFGPFLDCLSTDFNIGSVDKPSALSIRCIEDSDAPIVPVPILTTDIIKNITQTSAVIRCTISSDGGTPVTARGICWSTSPRMDTITYAINDGTGTGVFNNYLSGLTSNATYYVRAYAINSYGVGYGNELAFSTLPDVDFDTIADIDGNVYKTVVIGTQTWMAENLKTTKYNDGTAIPNVIDNEWGTITTPAYCWFNNDEATYRDPYGALYNWYSVNTGKLCPAYWHVPNDTEWTTLTDYLGGQDIAANKMKEVGTTHWISPNTGATNETGFTALPGGYRAGNAFGDNFGHAGLWWTNTEYDATGAWACSIESSAINFSGIYRRPTIKMVEYSVRCLQDTNASIAQVPLLTTTIITTVTSTTAISGGAISSDGGSPIMLRGICWSTFPKPDLTDNKTINNTGVDNFASSMSDLSPNTTYYVRAYAINIKGVGYGNELNFKTLNDGTINLQQGLIAYYPFNGNANDESGNGHNGTLYNDPQVVTGYMGSGYKFNGNSGIFIDNDISLHPPIFTVSLFFKPNIDFSDNYEAMLYQNQLCATPKSTGTLYLIKESRTLNTNTTFNNQYTALSSPNNSVKINEWNHALTLYDGDSLILFLNGKRVAGVYLPNANIPNNFHNQKIGIGTSSNVLDPMGCGGWFATEFFNGIIDEIRIYNRALNASEIQALYNENNVSMNTPAISVHKNSIFEIPVNASNIPAADNVIAYQFDFNFDSQKIQYQDYSIEGTLAENGNVQVKQINNKLSFAWAGQEPLSGSDQLIRLRFKAIGMGTSAPVITNFLLNTDSVKNISTGDITIFANYGDVDANGNIQAYDAALTLQYSVGLDPLPSIDPLPWEDWRITAANVDGQSGITAYDAGLILKYTVGLINSFPVQNLKKSTDNPQADVNITMEDGYLVFRSEGELYGLNISVAGNTEFLGTPQIPDPRVLSSTNISSGSYSVGLATDNALTNNDILLRIPLNNVTGQLLTIDMIVNQEVKQFSMALPTAVSESVQKSWEIFPNPANTILFFRNLPDNASVTIYDAQGNMLINRRINNNQIDISSLDNGIYIINIKADMNTMTQKLIKQ